MKRAEIAEARREAMLGHIKTRTLSGSDLCDILGQRADIIDNDLRKLARAKAIHWVTERRVDAKGLLVGVRVFKLGPKPDGESEYDHMPTYRPITHSWKPNNRRDPLVAALFGAPSNAPRCGCCRQLQGEPHAAGCKFIGLAA